MFDVLPEAFGSYRVIEGLGDGRFGPVYRGRHDAAGVAVAIKVFDQDLTSDQATRLAAMLDRLHEMPLDHPAIVPIVAAAADGHLVWLAERWFEGTPLDALMRRDGAQSPADVVLRVTQIGGALDFAAAVDLHHGALHPRDILVAGDLTALAGMGVLQALGDAGLVVPMEGAYVSPHRARGLPPARSDDIFSLAAITFELMVGAPVPARQDLRTAVPQLAGVDASRLADVLHRALSPEPDERPATALEFAAAIQAALTPIPVPIPIPIPDSDSQIPTPIPIQDSHSEIPIPHSDSSRASVPDLPLRAPELKPESRNQNEDRNLESEPRIRESESESESEFANRNPEFANRNP